MDTRFSYNQLTHPQIRLADSLPAAIVDEESHTDLLEYLLARVRYGNTERTKFLRRYSIVDKLVSTWQRLSPEDTNRKAKQEVDGTAQAIHINLPLTHTHLDDMVSFLAEVYAPASGNFFQNTEPQTQEATKELVEKLNTDSRRSKYYTELCKGLRSLLKYNIGGFIQVWTRENGDLLGEETDPKGWNRTKALDMYNTLWDPDVKEPAEVAEKAEWLATFSLENHNTLLKASLRGVYQGLNDILAAGRETSNGNRAEFYKNPPGHAGISAEDDTTAPGMTVDWSAYSASLASDSAIDINAHEVINMWCWLHAPDFGLKPATGDMPVQQLSLWHFVIVDGKRIASAIPVQLGEGNVTKEGARIPAYIGYLNKDDMGASQRSVAELLNPFQSFSSFLLNAHVSGTRGNIWGIQVYDPTVIDMAEAPSGTTVARIKTKTPGRDVRTAIQQINGQVDTGKALDSLNMIFSLVKEFFPSQAMPSQIASIDRAVTNQVAAVLQGINRRLHMTVRTLDDDILGPLRQDGYQNIIDNGAIGSTSGLTDDVARRVLGSGLAQLNREAASQAIQQLLFAIIQSPKSSEEIDVLGLMNYWSSYMNVDADLSQFRIQQPQGQPQSGQPGEQAQPTQADPTQLDPTASLS